MLKERGKRVVLASSAKAEEIEHYLDLLEVARRRRRLDQLGRRRCDQPDPDLVNTAIDKSGCTAGDAVMVGDTTWDCKAAARAGVPTVALLSGGFSEQELRDAGAVAIFPTPADLVERLAETPLGLARRR